MTPRENEGDLLALVLLKKLGGTVEITAEDRMDALESNETIQFLWFDNREGVVVLDVVPWPST